MKTLLFDFFHSGTEAQQGKKRTVALVLCATAIILAIALLVLAIGSVAIAIKNKAADGEEEESGDVKIPNGYTTTTLDPSQISAGNLLLVDADHPYVGPAPSVVLFNGHESRPTAADGKNVYSIGGILDLSATEETVLAFNAMVRAFYNDATVGGDNNLYISGAYNMNAANQADELYKLGTTLALKYYVYYNGSSDFELASIHGVEKYQWIYDHAHEYGFVPASAEEGKENLFRYVGPAHATYMHNNNKTFSEYITILQGKTYHLPLTSKAKNSEGELVTYQMYYLASGSELVVPSKWAYEVSGDNASGYIITVNKSKTLTK